MKIVVILIIKGYQKILSFIPLRVCRFYPSCSEYMVQSISKHGLIKGGWRGILRVLRCNPFHPGGYDPVG